jgi:hypothetical protein
MHVAAFQNKHEAVRELLATAEGKMMLNTKIKNMMVADRDVKDYKNQGSAINIKMQAAGLTPLAAAMASPDTSPELIATLVDAGAKEFGHFAFFVGCLQGSVANLAQYTSKMRERGAKGGSPGPAPWLNKTYMEAMGGTPLHAVAFMSDRASQREKMQWLLDNGAKPSIKKKWMMGGSPLMALSFNPEADPECFDMLVAAGCDPNEFAKPWRLTRAIVTVLKAFKAVKPCKFSAADDFIMMASGGNPIHFASFQGSIGNIKKLADHGAANDRKNRYGQLPAEVLVKKMPDSHAPEILGPALMPPGEKLKAVVLATQFAVRAKTQSSKTPARVLPNQPTAGALAVTPGA